MDPRFRTSYLQMAMIFFLQCSLGSIPEAVTRYEGMKLNLEKGETRFRLPERLKKEKVWREL